jgi:hypothetical protein
MGLLTAEERRARLDFYRASFIAEAQYLRVQREYMRRK